MKSITSKRLLSWDPCEDYDTKEKLLVITKGKTSLTAKEISNLRIPAEDRIWVLLRPEILGKRNYKEIGNKIADRAVKKHCLKCGIKEVEEWAENWLSGENRTNADAADAAAYAANAAYAATAAATSAANAANAAYAAAADAATARKVERKWQLSLIKKYL